MSLKEPREVTRKRQGGATKFKKGQSGNPGGMPIGTLNKIKTAFLTDVQDAWIQFGASTLSELAATRPDKFCELVAGLLPEEKNINVTAGTSTGLERLQSNIEWLRGLQERGRMERQSEVPMPERPLLASEVHAGEKGR